MSKAFAGEPLEVLHRGVVVLRHLLKSFGAPDFHAELLGEIASLLPDVRMVALELAPKSRTLLGRSFLRAEPPVSMSQVFALSKIATMWASSSLGAAGACAFTRTAEIEARATAAKKAVGWSSDLHRWFSYWGRGP